MQPLYRACLQLVISQIAFGGNVAICKKLAGTWSSSAIVSTRFLIAGTLLAILMKIQSAPLLAPESGKGSKLTKSDWGLLIGQALLGGVMFNALFQTGLMHVTTCCAGLLSSAFPMVMAISAYFLLGEKVTTSSYVGIFLTICGILSIHMKLDQGLHPEGVSIFGTFLILFALIPEALAAILARKQRGRLTPLGASTLVNLIGAVATFPILVTEYNAGRMPISSYSLSFIAIASTCTMVFYTGWLAGLKSVEATTAGIFAGIMPLSAAIFGSILLEESPSWNEGLAGMFITLSVVVAYLGARPTTAAEPVPT